MLSLWTLVAVVVRGWMWSVCRSADRWEAEYERRAMAAARATEQKPGNGTRTLFTEAEQIERFRSLAPLFERRDKAAAKWERKRHKAERLGRAFAWLTKPRTLAGGVAGAITVPGVLVAMTAGGIDVPGVLVQAAAFVRSLIG